MQKYELTLVFDAKTSPAKRKAVLASFEKIVTILKGKLGKMEEWGEKPFGTKIGKAVSGYYLHFPLELEGSQVKALNLKLKMEPEIIKSLIIKEIK